MWLQSDINNRVAQMCNYAQYMLSWHTWNIFCWFCRQLINAHAKGLVQSAINNAIESIFLFCLCLCLHWSLLLVKPNKDNLTCLLKKSKWNTKAVFLTISLSCYFLSPDNSPVYSSHCTKEMLILWGFLEIVKVIWFWHWVLISPIMWTILVHMQTFLSFFPTLLYIYSKITLTMTDTTACLHWLQESCVFSFPEILFWEASNLSSKINEVTTH